MFISMEERMEQSLHTKAAPARPTLRRNWLSLVRTLLLALAGIVIVGLGLLYAIAAATALPLASAPVLSPTTRFDGRYLLTASDADMIGTAYADDQLKQIPGAVDTLSLIELPVRDERASVVAIPVSNAVTSWPQISAVSPDGKTIYVVETSQPIDDAVTRLPTSAMPPGRLVTVIDISAGPATPRVREIDVGTGAVHLGLSADGAYLAVGLEEQGRQLAILPTATLDDPASFRYFAVERADGSPAREVTSVYWHPSGQFLAVGISAQEIQFYRVNRTPTGITLSPHGARITGGYTFSYGQFTSDGRFYLTSEIQWDRYPRPLGNLINPASEMISISFDQSLAAEHRIVSRVPVGLSSEGFALSPQEDLIATVDMSRTYLPDWLTFWPGTQLNSLTLVGFDRETGALEVLGEPYGFEGVLPEAAMFDSDGDALGVVIYNKREDPAGPGLVEFWNVVREGERPRLERTAVQIPVVRGPHAMSLIP
jgi:hypothetical protein